MIDLHIHTTYSDGTDSLIDILKQAQNLQLTAISITDHNTVNSYEELKNIDVKKYYKGKIIKGCEIGTIYEGAAVELLGYNINVDIIKPWLNKHFSEKVMIDRYNRYLDYMKGQCDEFGLMYSSDLKITNYKESPIVVFIEDINKYEKNRPLIGDDVWKSPDNFYRDCANNTKSPFYIDFSKDRVPFKEVVNQIKIAGGKVFLAHPYLYKWNNTIEKITDILNEYKIEGIECYYSTFTKEQTQLLIEFCNRHNLFISGGSDYHGNSKKVQLGIGNGNLNISDNIVCNWINTDI